MNKKAKNGLKATITYWLNFNNKTPSQMQDIYVLDKYGVIAPSVYKGDFQKEYWIENKYMWSVRPAKKHLNN